jgi:hypothetical protein
LKEGIYMALFDGCGSGCLLWFINNMRENKRNHQIEKNNEQMRGVEEYSKTDAGILFPPASYKDSIIISGSPQNIHSKMYETVLGNAHNARQPVIILHTANGALENIIMQNGWGTVISDRNPQFDAFVSFDFHKMVQVITDTCKSRYDIKPLGRYILQVAHDLLVSRKRTPYFNAFVTCDYFHLTDYISASRNSGTLTQSEADLLDSYILTAQSEITKIDTFFKDINAQIGFLSARDPAKVNAVSVLSAILSNQILCIDIRSSANIMLIELIVNSLIVAMNKALNFALMIDDIPLFNNELLKNTLTQRANHNSIIITNDLLALTGGKD